MLKIFYALTILLCLSSCATLSPKHYDVTIASAIPGAHAKIKDEEKALPAVFNITRSRTDTLHITLITDSLQKQYNVPPRLRPIAYAGNAVWLIWWPVAYYIDKKNDRGYSYGNHLFLDVDSTQVTEKSPFTAPVAAYNDTQKHHLNLTISIPYYNNFYLQPKLSPAIKTGGFWGYSVGVEYFYKENRFLRLSGLAAIDFFLPIIAAVDTEGEQEGTYTLSASLTNNIVLNRFTLGYGLTYAKNKWYYDNDGTNPDVPLMPGAYERQERATLSFGLQLNAYYRIVKSFYAGIIYNPYIYDIAPVGQFNYQHTISLDFLWKMSLPPRKKR